MRGAPGTGLTDRPGSPPRPRRMVSGHVPPAAVLPVLLAGGALAGEAAVYAAKRREIERLRRRCSALGVLALTYDDGPGPALTPRVLDLLAEHDARATFFALGRRAERAPELLDRVRDAGHELGCHGQDHVNAWRAAPWAPPRDIARGYRTLARWVAPDATFRPPHGKQTTVSRAAVRLRGAPVAWWTVDSGDTHATLPDPGHAAAQVVRDGGGVVLLHDHDEERDPARIEFVLTVTELLLRAATDRGWRVRALGDLAAGAAPAARTVPA
jgi:peptidoglycan/xylan/chitin deacetylase (PgdA/CDA1 family)